MALFASSPVFHRNFINKLFPKAVWWDTRWKTLKTGSFPPLKDGVCGVFNNGAVENVENPPEKLRFYAGEHPGRR